jgi:hypothetical protein
MSSGALAWAELSNQFVRSVLHVKARDRKGTNMRSASMATLAAIGIAGLAVAEPTSVAAATWLEVEHARAHARAGGPISEQDAEMLERYGCLSGTRNAFCQRLEHRGSERRYRKSRRWR